MLTDHGSLLPPVDRFVGTLLADGQTSFVQALVLDDAGGLVFASLVGPDASVSAAFGRLVRRDPVRFAPDPEVDWPHGALLTGSQAALRELRSPLPGLTERHLIVIAATAHLGACAQMPVTLPSASPSTSPLLPRIVLGTANATAPARNRVHAHLAALHLPVLPHWPDPLWDLGLREGLIHPLPALGMTAWSLMPDLTRWSEILGMGILTRRLTP